MSEDRPTDYRAAIDRAGDRPVTETLTDRIVRVARGVAAVLARHGGTASGAAETAAFVEGWADAYAADADSTDEADGATRLGRLAARFVLSPEELDLIVLAGLPDEHEGLAATFRAVHPTGEPHPTLGLAALLAGGSATDRRRVRELVLDGPAARHGLLRSDNTGAFFEHSLLLPDLLWPALQGHDAWPAEAPRVPVGPPPPGLTGWLAGAEATRARRALARDDRVLVWTGTEDEAAGLGRCAALAAAMNRPLAAARVSPGAADQVAQLIIHAELRGAYPVLVVAAAPERAAVRLADVGYPGPLLLCAPPGSVLVGPERALVAVPVRPVGHDDQRSAWAAAAPLHAEQAGRLAARHRMDPVHTAQIGIDLRAQGNHFGPAELSGLVRSRASAILPPGVELVTPEVDWEHLVLPEDGTRQLRDAVSRLDHQVRVLHEWGLRQRAHAGPGLRLLLCGTPGTGKTLAAQVVATAAGTDLLVVDVSRLVSKWLGETEKNLAAAFEAAERTQAVLMLDEADALFATRTEVSDAHDRYANLETAYLLQRLERFEGLAILTTNMRANIDPAFIRRLDDVIEFPLPNHDGRLRLWQNHLPEVCRSDSVDLPALAALYPVPGGWIRNACVDAAFAAAAAGGLITTDHLVAAMRRGYAKASVPFPGVPRRRHEHI